MNDMNKSTDSDARLRQAYEVLRALFEPEGEMSPKEFGVAYFPALPPLDPGSRLSATDLLSSWFRPPSGHRDPWQNLFRKFEPETPTAVPVLGATMPAASPGVAPTAVIRALLPDTEDELAAEHADSAVETLYAFLHAFGRHDVEGAMKYVAEDYHTFQDDREIDRNDLRNHLEALLESLYGWEFEVSLSMAPEPLRHPYGIIIYTEIQIDAVHPVSKDKRNMVERRLAVLQAAEDEQWLLSALSPIRQDVA